MVSPGRVFTQPGLSFVTPTTIRPSFGASHFGKRTRKPNSVRCGHSSRRSVTACAHQRPTRRSRQLLKPPCRIGPMRSRRLALGPGFPPYLVLLRVGFTLPPALLPARCALTAPFHPYRFAQDNSKGLPHAVAAVCFLWHWPSTGLYARVPDVIRHTALRSSDFPLPDPCSRRNPAATARSSCQ
jgi:hypothetical protein